MKKTQPKKVDWAEVEKQAAELRELTDKERRKHCRCCPAHPAYEEMNHEAYQ